MKALYFASVRDRIGVREEFLDPPTQVTTINDLIAWLRTRGSIYAEAFADGEAIRAAVDRRHVPHDAKVADAREVAFFPPMTGG